jgi:methylenetetrahydrofolate dehydrogenase (NADP+)/methenyltetrahydrofolate cyclohydrolase
MKIFNGKKESEKILRKLKAQIKKEKLSPHLAVFLIGNDKASKIYVNLKKQAAENIGVKFTLYKYKKNADENEIIKKIKELNKDERVSRIIVQLPLPNNFNTEKIISSIDPKKDADGFHKKNVKALKNGEKMNLNPVLPAVILHILKFAQKTGLEKKKIKALVNSRFFGEVLKSFFSVNGFELEFFVVKNASLKKIEKFTKDTDVLISVLGKKGLIIGEMLKKDVILIDAGITKKGKKVYGDFDFESCIKKAKFITPVSGGVGPMTVVFLLKNIVLIEREKILT